jgi:hypothetical protein
MPLLDEELYSIPDGAKELKISVWTLWDKLKKGDICRTKVCGKTFVRASELRKLIVDKTNSPRQASTRGAGKVGKHSR